MASQSRRKSANKSWNALVGYAKRNSLDARITRQRFIIKSPEQGEDQTRQRIAFTSVGPATEWSQITSPVRNISERTAGNRRERVRRQNPETLITAQIREILKIMRVPHWKHFATALSPRGIPDLVCVLPPNGRACYIEVKTPKGKVSPEQMEFISKVRESGAVAFVARSVRDVLEELRTEGFEPAKRVNIQ